MEIIDRWPRGGEYVELIVTDGNTRIESGLLNKDEALYFVNQIISIRRNVLSMSEAKKGRRSPNRS